MTDQENHPRQNNREKSRADDYMKYSGMAFQMAIIIFIGSFAGQKLDAHFQTPKPYFTIFLAVVGVTLAMYISLKDQFRKPGANK